MAQCLYVLAASGIPRAIYLYCISKRLVWKSITSASNNKHCMFHRNQLLFLSFILFCSSCNTGSGKYPYAIKDFRKPMQPYLTNIVSKGIVSFIDSTLGVMLTDKDLIQLSHSEHPILRGLALRVMLWKSSFNHVDIIMGHLDDTAIVGFDHGEFGIYYIAIADELLQNFEWKSIKDKNRVIDEVITKHNYLQSAYTILEKIQPREKYYPYIRDMATRSRKYEDELGERAFGDIEYALYGLAAFKKKKDIKIIQERLMTNKWQMGEVSFKLMREFPDSSYQNILEAYYPLNYYNSICRERSVDKATSFINTVAVYKNNRSAKILNAILKEPPTNCAVDTAYLREELEYAIWTNPCESYSTLRKAVAASVQAVGKNRVIRTPAISIDSSADPLPKEIRFW